MILLALLSTCIVACASAPTQDDDQVTPLFDEYWDWRLERSPEFASMVGSKKFNSKLELFTEKRFSEDQESCKVFIETANGLLDEEIDPGKISNLKFFIKEIETFTEGYPLKAFYFPMSYLEGVQVDFERLAEWASMETVDDYNDLLGRYEKFSNYADQVITMMRTAVEKHQTNHNASMGGVIYQCQKHLGKMEDTVFYQPFKNLSMFTEQEQKMLQERANSSITSSIQPGFSKLIDFLNTEYLVATRKDIGANSLSDNFYPACLKFHTSTDMTAQEIHDRGLAEVERIEGEMKEIVKEMGNTNMTLKEFTDMIRNDPENFYKSPAELLAAFKDIIDNKIEGHILEIFQNKPVTKLEIVEVPPSQPNAPAASYIAGTPDGSRPGRLYVNTNQYGSQPKYEMISLSLHETNPGHHLQNSYSLEQEDWPMFRKVKEDRIYSQSPSRFPINTAYGEGWGLYSETLGFDMGLYDEPLDRFGHFSEEIFRACRLVVDTGMHSLGWTQERAVQYMMDHTAASEESLRNEITRYITWPGQATAYKIGQMKILELRKRAEDQLGDLFVLRDFHEVVLRCRGPLSILESEVDEYIADTLSQLFDDYWTWRLKRSPEFATLVGSKDFNSILETFTEKRFEEDFESSKTFIARAEALQNQTDDADLLQNLDFFVAEVQTYVDGYKYNGFYFPVSYLEGVQVDFQRLSEWASLDDQKDYEDLIARYNLLDVYVDQVITMMTTAVDKNLTNNNASMDGVVNQCKSHLVETVEETVFYEPFENLTSFTQEVQEKLRAGAILAITSTVQPAFTNLVEFLETVYLPSTRAEIAVSTLPDIGEEYYSACLKFHTSTDLTAEEIHTKGLEEVERIEDAMKEIVVEMGYEDMPLQNFTEMIRNNQSNFYNSPEELLDAFHEIIENRIDSHLLSIFNNKPSTKLEIIGMPPSMADGPAAFYTAGTPDGSRPGVLYVNTNKFNSQPKYEMVSLSLHETNPGHHLQGSYSLEHEDWPMFRKVMEDRIYSQVPSRFPINTAFVEGWGLYSETLGFDMGLYNDPLDRFGHYSEEIFRACRLVVDTGMHSMNWTQEEAVQYMMKHTAASEASLRNEITRYITWPGQATAYKIGQMKILELRTRAEEALGEAFELRDYHDVVLNSAGPLNILEDQVDKYIKTNTATSGSTAFVINLYLITLACIVLSMN